MHDLGCFFFGDSRQGLAGMKPGTPLLQLEGLTGEDLLQLVGPSKQQPAVRLSIVYRQTVAKFMSPFGRRLKEGGSITNTLTPQAREVMVVAISLLTSSTITESYLTTEERDNSMLSRNMDTSYIAKRPSITLIVLLSLALSVVAQQEKVLVPTQQELQQLDVVLDASPTIGHLFRATPVKLVDPSVIAKYPSLQTLFKQNPDLLISIVRYKNAFQQREFRFAYGEAGTQVVPRTAVDWFDAYLVSTPDIAKTLRESPSAIDDPSVVGETGVHSFLQSYPMFSQAFKKHPSVYLVSPDFFKYYR
jgi:hypothetical protein